MVIGGVGGNQQGHGRCVTHRRLRRAGHIHDRHRHVEQRRRQGPCRAARRDWGRHTCPQHGRPPAQGVPGRQGRLGQALRPSFHGVLLAAARRKGQKKRLHLCHNVEHSQGDEHMAGRVRRVQSGVGQRAQSTRRDARARRHQLRKRGAGAGRHGPHALASRRHRQVCRRAADGPPRRAARDPDTGGIRCPQQNKVPVRRHRQCRRGGGWRRALSSRVRNGCGWIGGEPAFCTGAVFHDSHVAAAPPCTAAGPPRAGGAS